MPTGPSLSEIVDELKDTNLHHPRGELGFNYTGRGFRYYVNCQLSTQYCTYEFLRALIFIMLDGS